MKRVVLEQRLGFVATVTAGGRPNLSPKGTTTVFDDEHLLFADIASPGTVANLMSSPFVEVNVVDPIRRKGYRFRGTGEVHGDGEVFQRGLAVLEQRGYTTPRERIRAIVVIHVDEAGPLVSPVYATGAQEAAVIASWREHHLNLHAPQNSAGATFSSGSDFGGGEAERRQSRRNTPSVRLAPRGSKAD